MAYEFHVFLSYRRHGEWTQWVKEKFLPLFLHWLGEELGENAQVFFDQRILEAGKLWPQESAYALARSRVLVPLLSRQYFNSEWCKTELAHMCARETISGMRKAQPPKSLIVPAVLHDGNDFPKHVSAIMPTYLQDCANVRTAKDSPTEEELSKRIRDSLVPSVVCAIHRAPGYDPYWENLAVSEFLRVFNVSPPKQKMLPSLGLQ